MAEFRFEAIAPDGAEFRNTIHARDYEAARAALQEKGLLVYRLKSSSLGAKAGLFPRIVDHVRVTV